MLCATFNWPTERLPLYILGRRVVHLFLGVETVLDQLSYHTSLIIGRSYTHPVCHGSFDTLQRRFIPETSTSQKFGQSVAISACGNIIAIGSPDDAPSGSVSVYIRHADNIWTQQASRLIGSRGTPGAQQGCAVALSADGNVLAVGGKGCTSNSGGAWLFIRDAAGVWKQQGDKLVGTGAVGYSQQGCSVALSADGSTLAVGGSADNRTWARLGIFSKFL